jgi:hypothetical protein
VGRGGEDGGQGGDADMCEHMQIVHSYCCQLMGLKGKERYLFCNAGMCNIFFTE